MKRISMINKMTFRKRLIENCFLGIISKGLGVKGLGCSQFMSLKKRIIMRRFLIEKERVF
jgi:hypothetical protein